ncbi:MAG: hypothetical protein GY832_44960 [Chloroflexi bacterium]|nr:hypothetical protein [Chloroflexota bacterium]
MSAIPQLVIAMVNKYFKPLLVWFSEKVYAELVARARDHILVKLHDKLNSAGEIFVRLVIKWFVGYNILDMGQIIAHYSVSRIGCANSNIGSFSIKYYSR